MSSTPPCGGQILQVLTYAQKEEVTLTLEPNSHTLSPLLPNTCMLSPSTHLRVCTAATVTNTPTGCANARLVLVGDAFLSGIRKKDHNSCARDDSSVFLFFFVQKGLDYSQWTVICLHSFPFDCLGKGSSTLLETMWPGEIFYFFFLRNAVDS